MSNKLNELKIVIDQSTPDLVGISETWFNEKSLRNIDGFTHYSRDRSGSVGGVIIYVKNSFKSFEVVDNKLDSTEIEHVKCKIVSGIDLILVGCLYRPPNFSRETSLKINNTIKYAKSLIQQKVV